MAFVANKENTSWRIVDGEAVVIHLETTHYYSLNPTGTFIWNLIADKPLAESAIVASVAEHYDQTPEQVAGDVENLLSELLQEKLIEDRPE